MLNIFILENEQERLDWFNKIFNNHNIYATKSISDACDKVANNKFDLIFLDRDLGNPNENGEDLAWFMFENKLAENTPVLVHTMNDRGQRVISRYLNKYKKNVFSMRFNDLKKHSCVDILELTKINKNTENNSKEIKKENQSAIDFLINNLSVVNGFKVEKTAKAKAIENLYSIWKDSKNKINDKIFQKSDAVSYDELENMERQGVISIMAKGRFKITSEGSKLLKIMILGDNRCSLEKGNNKLDYRTAEATTKKSKKLSNWINRVIK